MIDRALLTLLLIGFVISDFVEEIGEAFDRLWEQTFTKPR